jgi:hypothetical protein
MVPSESFNTSDWDVETAFSNFYLIPDYQREYVWTDAEVELLLSDIHRQWDLSTHGQPLDYFLGTIVTVEPNPDGYREVVDGQQRLTTLYLILCAVRDVLAEYGDTETILESQIRAKKAREDGYSADSFRLLLQYKDAQGTLEAIGKSREDSPVETIPESTPSARRLVDAYRDAQSFITTRLEGKDADETRQNVRGFWGYLIKRVRVVNIETTDIGRALWIFETINQRGLSLDSMDLLKNLLFREAEPEDFARLRGLWKSMLDSLADTSDKPLRFVRAHLMAHYSTEPIRAEQVYRWITTSGNPEAPLLEDNPVAFAEELLASARQYRNLLQGKTTRGTPCDALSNIGLLSRTARQHLIVMLACKDMSDAEQAELASELEALAFVTTITGQSPSRLERKYVEWATSARTRGLAGEDNAPVRQAISEYRASLAIDFEFQFMRITEQRIPRYRLRYLLARLAQHLEAAALGHQGGQVLTPYLDRSVEVEHILSRAPSESEVAQFGGPDAALAHSTRLGNLTLLERPLNAAAGNLPFPQKAELYRESKFYITSSLVPRSPVGKDTSVSRTLARMSSYTEWTPHTLADRERVLLALALETWRLPDARKEPERGRDS